MEASLSLQAESLIARLAMRCSKNDDFGSMSSSIYDTAWLAMIKKPDGQEWLFPECFDFILKCQQPLGDWDSYSTSMDGILNTAASLLALRKHLEESPGNVDWVARSIKAERILGRMLDSLDVNNADQATFGILIIKHVELLRDHGIILKSRKLEDLRKFREMKLAMLSPTSVYDTPSTLYYSLEALIGHIDYDKISRWREPNGSMMGSPSSTAAYLMYASSWDSSAETYLRNVLKFGYGNGDGGVPSAFPSSLFETAWTVSTLLGAGFHIAEDEARTVGTFLQQALELKGVVGFAPGSYPDADDAAKTLITLRSLGYSPSADGLLAFETQSHFTTYPKERYPSFSTNCHVLSALLKSSDPVRYVSQIHKATVYLTSRALASRWGDKWVRGLLHMSQSQQIYLH
ncbi:hypothetical protein F5B22DRAFT_138040 [Xylaria bambusicola]|uniref:uncharacterized protein n=1 Tax=Xylaria bambusicola TaxID=326684 RepID=UPI002008D9C4|nr:uncharacterized protein F5B22DRAFT_138040 [Xylaria bambusicola]KAI0516929.1 hypothetical protein F5B22DRAFT_138040 [Xylaria bambusicola]